MITPSFALTATERLLPRLALDFTTGTFDPRITLTRAGYTAGYINSSGNLVVANPNQPRIDYDPVTGACNGLLIEESRSNLAVGDNMINVISLSTCSLQANATPAKSFKGYADKLVPTTANVAHSVGIVGTVVSGSTYTISFIAKQAGYTKIFGWGNVTGAAWSFDLAAGTSTGTGATIKSVGDGFYLCSYPYTPSSTSGQVRLYVDSASAFAGDGTSGVYVYGWQWELGSFATSRIYNAWNTTSTSSVSIGGGARTFTITLDATNPLEAITAGSLFNAYTPDYVNGMSGTVTSHTGTTLVVNVNVVVGSGTYSDWVIGAYAAGATRNADVATMTGTNFSDWYNASEGAFVAGVRLNTLVTPAVKPVFAAYDGTFNSNRVYLNVGISGQTNLLVNSGGSSQVNAFGPVLSANNLMKVSSKYKINDFALAANGITPATDTSGVVPVGSDRLDIGVFQPASAYLNGHVAFLNYYPLALTNNEVQAFSK